MNFNFKLGILVMGGLALFASIGLEGSHLPVSLGPPIRVSPVPGPANPDPIVQNLVEVMDEHYQAPFYPTPNDLSTIYILSNYYVLNHIQFNPCNNQVVHCNITQNLVLDFTGTYLATLGTSVLATSRDNGRHWKYGAPPEQIIPLGGTVSEIINTSLGPGTYSQYDKNGKLLAAGYGFFDMVTHPPATTPQSGFIRTFSDDDGKTWSPVKIDLANNVAFWYRGNFGNVGVREFYPTIHPAKPNLVHASSMFELNPFQFYGSANYTRSTDGGKTFAPFKQIYNMIDDPSWRAKFYDPNFPDPTYYAYGGFTLLSSFPVQVDDNIVMLPADRLLAQLFPLDGDQAAIRSLDNGKTWLKTAGSTELYTGSPFVFDPGFANPIAGGIVKGVPVQGFWGDTSGQWSAPQVSPTTGRIYLTFSAANTEISDFDTFAIVSRVVLSSSSDKGATFSPIVQINRTPTNIQPGAQQAWSSFAAVTSNGYYLVGYYDFRNWTGTPGEDVETTPLQTDVWLDVYRETVDPLGGSTGVGLDFVGEIRLTDESYNSRIISLTTPIPYSTPFITGTPEGIGLKVNSNNEVFVIYTTQSSEGVSPANITQRYKGVFVDTNGYVTGWLRRFKFANSTNE